MPAEQSAEVKFEIGHVLFIDIVSYSKLLIEEQKDRLRQLTGIVLSTSQVAKSTDEQLVRLPTGDGMALVFRNSSEEPARSALELAHALKEHPEIQVRMGIHSGPVSEVTDVNGRTNIAGAGINLAQRVMDCGDAGHILVSQRVADDLAQYRQWSSSLHELGECEVKHGVRLHLVNLYTADLGNPALPARFQTVNTKEQAAPRPARRGKRLLLTVAVLICLLLGAAVAVFIFRPAGSWFFARQAGAAFPPAARSAAPAASASAIPAKSIAVLPFENLSEEKENAYFAAGVQDEILTDLAKIADLKVISRTSVMQYKPGSERNLREIARALGVAHVVEGSVQRVGAKVRVNAQLIDAQTDAHEWAEDYDRPVDDVFAIQSEIAQKIADQLRSKISPAEKTAIAEQPTTDLQAYGFYIEARTISSYDDWSGVENSLARKSELLQKAIQRDPKFALAYCELAKTQCDLFEESSDETHLAVAKEALATALRIRPDLGDTHRELARYYYHTGELTLADRELVVALRDLPNDSETYRIMGEIASVQGRWNDALANLQKARELDPRNGEVAYHLAGVYEAMRRYKEWERLVADDAAQHSGPNLWRDLAMAEIKLDQGDLTTAQDFLARIPLDFSPTDEIWNARRAVALYLRDYPALTRIIAATPVQFAEGYDTGSPPASWVRGWTAQQTGDPSKAEAIFTAARKKANADEGVTALLDAALGRKEAAIEEAQRAVEQASKTSSSRLSPTKITKLAMVYTLTGERELAIDKLEVVAKIPAGPSYGNLRFNPVWDSLRENPRFQKIVASLTPDSAASK